MGLLVSLTLRSYILRPLFQIFCDQVQFRTTLFQIF